MGSKEQALLRTSGSLGFALLYAVITHIEDLADERGLDLGDFSVSWALKDRLLSNPMSLLASGRVEVFSSRVSEPVSRRVEIWGKTIDIAVTPGFGEESIIGLYRSAARMLSLDASIVREKAAVTSRSGTEFMFIYLDNGELAMFEGEVYRVRLPFVRAVATVHTHPEGSCGLSLPDIQSGLDLLSEGGLLSGAATPTCLAYMARIGLLTIDDYVAVKEALYYKRHWDLWKTRFRSLEFGVTTY